MLQKQYEYLPRPLLHFGLLNCISILSIRMWFLFSILMVWQQEICNQGNITYFLSLQFKKQLFFIHKMKSPSFLDYLLNFLLTTHSNKFPVCKRTSHLRCFLKIAVENKHLSSYVSFSSMNPRGFCASLVYNQVLFWIKYQQTNRVKKKYGFSLHLYDEKPHRKCMLQ